MLRATFSIAFSSKKGFVFYYIPIFSYIPICPIFLSLRLSNGGMYVKMRCMNRVMKVDTVCQHFICNICKLLSPWLSNSLGSFCTFESTIAVCAVSEMNISISVKLSSFLVILIGSLECSIRFNHISWNSAVVKLARYGICHKGNRDQGAVSI